MEELLLDQQVCFPLYAATNLLDRLYGPVLGELGLTYPQYLIMPLLWGAADGRHIRSTSLSRHWNLDAPSEADGGIRLRRPHPGS